MTEYSEDRESQYKPNKTKIVDIQRHIVDQEEEHNDECVSTNNSL